MIRNVIPLVFILCSTGCYQYTSRPIDDYYLVAVDGPVTYIEAYDLCAETGGYLAPADNYSQQVCQNDIPDGGSSTWCWIEVDFLSSSHLGYSVIDHATLMDSITSDFYPSNSMQDLHDQVGYPVCHIN